MLRFTDDEFKPFANQKNLATTMRKMVLGMPPPPPAPPPKYQKKVVVADPAILRELGKIGGNMNQIAKKVNSIDDSFARIEHLSMLAVIQEQLDELLAYVSQNPKK